MYLVGTSYFILRGICHASFIRRICPVTALDIPLKPQKQRHDAASNSDKNGVGMSLTIRVDKLKQITDVRREMKQ